MRGGTYLHVKGDILKLFLSSRVRYYASQLSAIPHKIPRQNFDLSDGKWNKLPNKLSAETRFNTLTARFGSVVLSVVVDLNFLFPYSPPPYLRGSIKWKVPICCHIFV